MNEPDKLAAYLLDRKEYGLNHFEFIDHVRLVICVLLRMKSGQCYQSEYFIYDTSYRQAHAIFRRIQLALHWRIFAATLVDVALIVSALPYVSLPHRYAHPIVY